MITHRLSTVRYFDMIAVMQDGQLVECGSHQELMQQHVYKELLKKQEELEAFQG